MNPRHFKGLSVQITYRSQSSNCSCNSDIYWTYRRYRDRLFNRPHMNFYLRGFDFYLFRSFKFQLCIFWRFRTVIDLKNFTLIQRLTLISKANSIKRTKLPNSIWKHNFFNEPYNFYLKIYVWRFYTKYR